MNPWLSRALAGALALAILSGCCGCAAEGEDKPSRKENPASTFDTSPLPPVSGDVTPPTTGSLMINEHPELTAPTSDPEEPEASTSAPEDDDRQTGETELQYTTEVIAAKMYATDTLNVRAEPTTEADVVGQLNPGDEAEVIGVTSHGWYQISFNGGKPFVYGEYLATDKPEIPEEEIIIPDGYRFAEPKDYFFIVNKEIRLPEDYSIETDFIQGSYELEVVAAKHCKEMLAAAKEDGIELKILSAYRTVAYQQKLFDRNVKSRMESGMSYEEAVADVSVNIAPPGGSEHNAGLAVDIIEADHWDTYTEFEDTEEFRWLMEHCHEYGFILRYLKGKEDITGYIYEPWHFRYVGKDYAKDVMDSGLCLEEYFEARGLN